MVQVFDSVFCHDDHIFDPDSAKISPVEARLDGEDVAFEEFDSGRVEERWFVDIQSDSVTRAMVHRAVGKGCPLWREAGVKAARGQFTSRRGVNFGSGDSWTNRGASAGFRGADGGVHFNDLVGDVAMDDGPRAIAAIVSFLAGRIDIDDDRFTSSEIAVPMVMAGCSLGASRNDEPGSAESALHEKHIDRGMNSFRREWRAIGDEDARRARLRPGDHLAGRGNSFFGDGLRAAEHFDLVLVFLTTFENAETEIADDVDPGFTKNMSKGEWKGPVCGDLSDARLVQAFGSGLSGRNFPIGGEASCRCEICRHGDAVRADCFEGTIQFDIADETSGALIFNVEIDDWISDGELCHIKERAVLLRNAGADCGSGERGHVWTCFYGFNP